MRNRRRLPRRASSARGPLRALLVVALVGTASCSDGPTHAPPADAVDLALPWKAASPEAAGMDGGDLFVAAELAGRIDRFRSLVVVREGSVVLERYYGGWTSDTLADVRSVTKSLVSTLVGVALSEGHIASLDDPITALPSRHRRFRSRTGTESSPSATSSP